MIHELTYIYMIKVKLYKKQKKVISGQSCERIENFPPDGWFFSEGMKRTTRLRRAILNFRIKNCERREETASL